tara:strand:+ start:16063 stop:16188 length:126 start_codon:yes stop_codon:yes gene_type:complete
MSIGAKNYPEAIKTFEDSLAMDRNQDGGKRQIEATKKATEE